MPIYSMRCKCGYTDEQFFQTIQKYDEEPESRMHCPECETRMEKRPVQLPNIGSSTHSSKSGIEVCITGFEVLGNLPSGSIIGKLISHSHIKFDKS